MPDLVRNLERKRRDARRSQRLAALALFTLLAGPAAFRAEVSALEACETRNALLEKRLYALQQRLVALEHEVASRPKPPPREPWRDAAAWRELRVGMSQADVLRILGAPGRVTSSSAFQRWEYPDALGERVNFDEAGRLLVWGPLAR